MKPTTLNIAQPLKLPVRVPNDNYFLPSGLEVFYDMADSGSTSIQDRSGKGITGTLYAVNSPSVVIDTAAGPVRYFDGGDDFIDMPLVIASGAMSFEFWVKPVFQSINCYLFDSQTGRKVAGYTTTNKYQIFNGSAWVPFNAVPVDGVWAHVVYIFAGASGSGLYVNGVFESGGDSGVLAVGGSVKIGTQYSGVAPRFKGSIGLFRAYSKALTQNDATALFAQDRARFGI